MFIKFAGTYKHSCTCETETRIIITMAELLYSWIQIFSLVADIVVVISKTTFGIKIVCEILFLFYESLKIKNILCWVSNANSFCFYENDVAISSLFTFWSNVARAQIICFNYENDNIIFGSFSLFNYLSWTLLEHGRVFTSYFRRHFSFFFQSHNLRNWFFITNVQTKVCTLGPRFCFGAEIHWDFFHDFHNLVTKCGQHSVRFVS